MQTAAALDLIQRYADEHDRENQETEPLATVLLLLLPMALADETPSDQRGA